MKVISIYFDDYGTAHKPVELVVVNDDVAEAKAKELSEAGHEAGYTAEVLPASSFEDALEWLKGESADADKY